jgi:hypothetical protein
MATKYSRRTRSRRYHKKRGGNLGSIINTALVPASIFAMQQTYRRKKKGGKTRKYRKH